MSLSPNSGDEDIFGTSDLFDGTTPVSHYRDRDKRSSSIVLSKGDISYGSECDSANREHAEQSYQDANDPLSQSTLLGRG